MNIFKSYETFKVLFYNPESITLFAMFLFCLISGIILFLKTDMTMPEISREQWIEERKILDKEEKEMKMKRENTKYFKWLYR